MSFPNILEQVFTMKNSDINVVGEFLGFDWNKVCEEISRAGFYAEDGDGSILVEREEDHHYSDSEIIDHIFRAIFENYPQVNEITVVN